MSLQKKVTAKFSEAVLVGSSRGVVPACFLEFLRSSRFLVAVDGGLKVFQQVNITPHLILGDLDSAPENQWKEYQSQTRIIRYPRHKDHVDLVLAAKWLVRREMNELFVFGWGDDRIDYGLSFLWEVCDLPAQITAFTDRSRLSILNRHRSKIEVSGNSGDTVSIFPLSKELSLHSRGLRWEVNWKGVSAPTHSQSNELLSTSAHVEVTEGAAFILEPI